MDRDEKTGLTSEQVAERIAKGLVNHTKEKTSRSTCSILRTNICTLFNAINLVICVLILITGQWRNAFFMCVVIINTVIGIFQEIRAKRKLDALKVLNDPHPSVLRDGKVVTIDSNEIVLDDIVFLGLGDQVASDCVLLEGGLAADESILTGESNDILKRPGDLLYAGSYIVYGKGRCKVTAVGEDNYIDHILAKAKQEKRQASKLYDAINFIIRLITYVIGPLGLILFLKQYFLSDLSFNEAIVQTAASVIGMIPEGLVLLTSVALSIGALKLSYKSTLAQNLYSLETLACTDVICFDKTGTITSGAIEVTDIIKYEDFDENIIANILHSLDDHNATAYALRSYFKVKEPLVLDDKFPFSSRTKNSGAIYNGHEYRLGAYSYLDLIVVPKEAKDVIDKYTSLGFRTIAISKDKKLIGIVIMRDEIRKEAKEIIKYFYEQDIDLKVISGDDAKTVSHIAKSIGINKSDDYIDCQGKEDDELRELVLNHSVFGRVSPDQKAIMIASLKDAGHTVGMVGDGVNDVMALKEADCSVAMFQGAQSAKNVASIVLMDNDFSHMPDVIDEGRRIINNIQRTASLFLIKTVMSMLLGVLSILFLREYPFSPIQLTLVSSLCIGIPSFILTFEPNYNRVSGNFLANILSRAIPSAIAIVFIGILLRNLLYLNIIVSEHMDTMYTLIAATIIIFNIYAVSKPLRLINVLLIVNAAGGMLIAYLFFPDFFYFTGLDAIHLVLTIVLAVLGIVFLKIVEKLDFSKWLAKHLDDKY